ncbi:MAG: CRISPR-associated endonuclease Cas1 [Salinibacter sp.]
MRSACGSKNPLCSTSFFRRSRSPVLSVRARRCPHVGVQHAERPGRQALTSDLIEQSCPPVDSPVLSLTSRKALAPADFSCLESVDDLKNDSVLMADGRFLTSKVRRTSIGQLKQLIHR